LSSVDVSPFACLLVRAANWVVVNRFAAVVVRPAICVVERLAALSASSTVEVATLS